MPKMEQRLLSQNHNIPVSTYRLAYYLLMRIDNIYEYGIYNTTSTIGLFKGNNTNTVNLFSNDIGVNLNSNNPQENLVKKEYNYAWNDNCGKDPKVNTKQI